MCTIDRSLSFLGPNDYYEKKSGISHFFLAPTLPMEFVSKFHGASQQDSNIQQIFTLKTFRYMRWVSAVHIQGIFIYARHPTCQGSFQTLD